MAFQQATIYVIKNSKKKKLKKYDKGFVNDKSSNGTYLVMF